MWVQPRRNFWDVTHVLFCCWWGKHRWRGIPIVGHVQVCRACGARRIVPFLGLIAMLMTSCAIVPTERGRMFTVGHSIVIANTDEWEEIHVIPTALDDNTRIERRETEAGTEFAVEKTAGEGLRLNFFSAAIGAIGGWIAAGL